MICNDITSNIKCKSAATEVSSEYPLPNIVHLNFMKLQVNYLPFLVMNSFFSKNRDETKSQMTCL